MYKQMNSVTIIIMDIRLENGAIIQVVGPSGCGKTHFVCQLLQTKTIFKNPIRKIYWHQGIVQDEANETGTLFKGLRNCKVIKGFDDGWMKRPKQFDVIVIDDLFSEANREKDFNNLFTKVARHSEVTVIFITQNMFHQGGSHRTRNINVHYLVLFKNPRDRTVINFVARQAYPNNYKFLTDAFHDATEDKPHGYLFIDFTQNCPEILRVRTQIFKDMIVYKQIKKSRG